MVPKPFWLKTPCRRPELGHVATGARFSDPATPDLAPFGYRAAVAMKGSSLRARFLAVLCLAAVLCQPCAASRADPAKAPAAEEAAAAVDTPGIKKSSIVVGAADGSDDHIRAHVEVRCHSLKYTLACDLNKVCDTISCTGMAEEEILDAYTPQDAAELLQGALDAWASDVKSACRVRETLGEGPSCIEKLFPYGAAV